VPLLEEASRRGGALVKVHSHPGGFPRFSRYDDNSDTDLFSSIHGWFDDDFPHASAVMLPDGVMFGRAIMADGTFNPLSCVSVAGDDLHFWNSGEGVLLPEFTKRHAQAFGKGTTARLRKLSAAVVGCSGTGSPVIEQLTRLGIGSLVLVDPQGVEEKNVNRILNTQMDHARAGRLKVDVLADTIRAIGLGTEVTPVAKSLLDPDVIRLIAECDLVFGCMDSVEGRHVLNRIATFYLQPYFDMGVLLEADGQGGIEQIFGTVHYIQPGRSSLLSRGVYTLKELHAEGLHRTDPTAYAEQLRSGYIVGVQEDRPAVISVNMQIAAMGVNEFLARLHPYRDDPNGDYAIHRVSLNQGVFYKEREGSPCRLLLKYVGRGDMDPSLDMPALSGAGGLA
jgi:hypothetical protein